MAHAEDGVATRRRVLAVEVARLQRFLHRYLPKRGLQCRRSDDRRVGWPSNGWLETTHFIADSWTVLISLLQKGWNRFSGFFQKVWARIQGLFGDTNAEAEIAKINDEIARQDELINNSQNQTILDREKQRQKARNKIEQDRQGAQSALSDMQSQEQSALEAANQKALADSAAELEKARGEWKSALGEAAAKRAETSPGSSSKFSLSGMALPNIDAFDQTLADTKKKTDVVGTFNPIAAMNWVRTHWVSEPHELAKKSREHQETRTASRTWWLGVWIGDRQCQHPSLSNALTRKK